MRDCESRHLAASSRGCRASAPDARSVLLQDCYARLDDAGRERLLEYAAMLCDSGDYSRDGRGGTFILKDVRRLCG